MEWKVEMTSETGNNQRKSLWGKRGFTLVEVLLSVSLLAIGLASVLEGYRNILGVYGRARLLMAGLSLLEEKMGGREIEIRGGPFTEGSLSGKEGDWNWFIQTSDTNQKEWYEVKGEVWGERKPGAITLYRYIRR